MNSDLSSSFLQQARMIWRRHPTIARSPYVEERDFREFFGCSPPVVVSLWGLLVKNELVPKGGSIEKLLWALMFKKTYGKEKTMCTLVGGIDPKTFRKIVWEFISAIASLEGLVVSNLFIINTTVPIDDCIHYLCQYFYYNLLRYMYLHFNYF